MNWLQFVTVSVCLLSLGISVYTRFRIVRLRKLITLNPYIKQWQSLQSQFDVLKSVLSDAKSVIDMQKKHLDVCNSKVLDLIRKREDLIRLVNALQTENEELKKLLKPE